MLVSWMDSNMNQAWTELTPEYGICWTGVISNKMLSLFKRLALPYKASYQRDTSGEEIGADTVWQSHK